MLERVARSRIEIDAARLQVLNAAITIDTKDAKFALKEIAEAKVLVPQMALDVIDRAIQAYGAIGTTRELAIGNYVKRLMVYEASYGSTAHHAELYAAIIADPDTAGAGLLLSPAA